MEDCGAAGCASGDDAVTMEIENGGGCAPAGADGAGSAVTVTADMDWPVTTVASSEARRLKVFILEDGVS